MEYEEILKLDLIDTPNRLWIENIEPHVKLNKKASQMFEQNTIEGRIASVFIYNQLQKEILKLVLLYIDLIEKCKAYPKKIKEHNLDIPIGNIISYIKDSFQFEGKEDILILSKKLNATRNLLAHKMIRKYDSVDIMELTSEIKDAFEYMHDIFNEQSLRFFYKEINRLKNRENIRALIDRDTET